jgi:hypothetical protein
MDVPFTVEQFLGVFTLYNEAVWPAQTVLYLLAAALVWLAARGRAHADRWVGGGLALLWAWMGVVYHWAFFSAINQAAWLFGALFLLQAILFVGAGVLAGRLHFHARPDGYGVTGAVMIGYALVLYPILGALAGHAYPRGPTFGLPCPTAIFTFGILLWADRGVPWWVLVIPAAWSLLGSSAAVSFGITEDYGLIVAGVVGTSMLLWRNRRLRELRAASRSPAPA